MDILISACLTRLIEWSPTVQIMYRKPLVLCIKEYHIFICLHRIINFTYFTHFYFKIFPCSYFIQSMSVVYCSAVNVQCSAVYLLRWSLAQCMSRYRTLALSMLTASNATNIYSDLVTHKKIFWWLGCPPLPLSLPLLAARQK